MKNTILKATPLYVPLFILAALFCNSITYWISRLLAAGKPHINMTTPLDQAIPLLPWMVTIYLGCYLFWAVNYYLAFRFDRQRAVTFLFAHAAGEAIAFLFFVFLPTTMVRPDLPDKGVWIQLLHFVYNVDPADNLFPSLHCYTSWMCWIGVRKNPFIPGWYRTFSLIGAILVCITVLTVKQHVFADVVSGVLLAEISFCILSLLRNNQSSYRE